jgi:hypothetical protein
MVVISVVAGRPHQRGPSNKREHADFGRIALREGVDLSFRPD